MLHQQMQMPRYGPPQSYRGYGGGDPQEDVPTNTVFLGRLDETLIQDPTAFRDLLQRVFSQYGPVLQVDYIVHKGIAFVHYRSVPEAQSAVASVRANGALGVTSVRFGRMYEYDANGNIIDDPRQRGGRGGGGGFGGPGGFQGGRGGYGMGGPMGYGGQGGYGGPGGFQGGYGGGRGGGFQGGGFGAGRPPRTDAEPSNIIFVAGVPNSMPDLEISRHFGGCPGFVNVTRSLAKFSVFVHFDSVEHATAAMQALANQPLAGANVRLLYGWPRQGGAMGAVGMPAGMPAGAPQVEGAGFQ
jgi:hypothetical protein